MERIRKQPKKRLSPAQVKKSEKSLKIVRKELALAIYETFEIIKEIQDLKTHHVFCVLSFKNLDTYLRDLLQIKDFKYVMTVNYLCEICVYYKVLREMPKRLNRLAKKVLNIYIKLHGEPPQSLLKEF